MSEEVDRKDQVGQKKKGNSNLGIKGEDKKYGIFLLTQAKCGDDFDHSNQITSGAAQCEKRTCNKLGPITKLKAFWMN